MAPTILDQRLALRRAVCSLILAAPFLWSCSTTKVSLREGPRSYAPSDYTSVLKQWTREKSLHSLEEMDNVLTVTSTYQSWDFRYAYTERYADDYRLSQTEKADFLERSLSASQAHHEFLVALYAQQPRWGKLDSDNALWIVRLVDSSGKEIAPLSIDEVRKPSAMEQTYYPYINGYRKVFRLTFPKRAAGGAPLVAAHDEWFGLKFSSAQGETTLTWRLE